MKQDNVITRVGPIDFQHLSKRCMKRPARERIRGISESTIGLDLVKATGNGNKNNTNNISTC